MLNHARVNLLPEDVQVRIRNRRLMPKLVLAQVVILFAIWLAVHMAGNLERQAWDDLRAANLTLFNIQQSPEAEALASAQAMVALQADMGEFLYMHAPAGFNPVWLDSIVAVVYEHLQELTYNGESFLLRGSVYSHAEIDVARQALDDTGLFVYVGLGSTRTTPDGRVIYELRLVPLRLQNNY